MPNAGSVFVKFQIGFAGIVEENAPFGAAVALRVLPFPQEMSGIDHGHQVGNPEHIQQGMAGGVGGMERTKDVAGIGGPGGFDDEVLGVGVFIETDPCVGQVVPQRAADAAAGEFLEGVNWTLKNTRENVKNPAGPLTLQTNRI